MAKKTNNVNQKLDAEPKNQKQLHEEWVQALEEQAVTHMELRDARQRKRDAEGAFVDAQLNETLTDDGRQRVNRKLLRSIQLESRVREEARKAREKADAAYEALGLPPGREPADLEDEELLGA